MDTHRVATRDWLMKYVTLQQHTLYMRPAGDYRPDFEIKLEMLDHMRKDGWNPVLAFDDRQQVVDMLRAEGIKVAQVAEGAF